MVENINTAIFEYINQFAGSNLALDNIAVLTAKYMPFVFILWLLYLWLKHNNECKDIVLYSAYSAAFGLAINFLIGLFYYHPRPFMAYAVKLLIHHKPENSFPSDHTTFMLSIAFMLFYFKKTRASGLAMLILGLAGGIARVFCGVHFPMDIIGSLLVSLLASLVIYLSRDKFKALNKFAVSLWRVRNEGKNIQ